VRSEGTPNEAKQFEYGIGIELLALSLLLVLAPYWKVLSIILGDLLMNVG
jgi:hypothetical protein